MYGTAQIRAYRGSTPASALTPYLPALLPPCTTSAGCQGRNWRLSLKGDSDVELYPLAHLGWRAGVKPAFSASQAGVLITRRTPPSKALYRKFTRLCVLESPAPVAGVPLQHTALVDRLVVLAAALPAHVPEIAREEHLKRDLGLLLVALRADSRIHPGPRLLVKPRQFHIGRRSGRTCAAPGAPHPTQRPAPSTR